MEPIPPRDIPGESGRVSPASPDAAGVACARVGVARQAQAAWSRTPLSVRCRLLRRFRHLLAEDGRDLAARTGAVRGRSAGEVLCAEILPIADAVCFLERELPRVLAPRRLGARGRPLWLAGCSAEIRREPLGVVLVVAPSNYPLFLSAVPALQALAAGNAVCIKPAPGSRDLVLHLGHLLGVSGLPAGLWTVLPEDNTAVRAAIDAGIQKLVFTGSARSAARIFEGLHEPLPMVLELSGMDAAIVREDADLDLTARALMFGGCWNGGATCIAPRRVFVAQSVASELEGRLERAGRAVEPIGMDSGTELRLRALLAGAIEGGAHRIAGEVDPGAPLRGPIVLGGVRPGQPLLEEDLFAPVMALVSVLDDHEAIDQANRSAYGLGASIFTRDASAAWRMAARLEVGLVQINDLIVPSADPRLPFGGAKGSGFGRTRGREGLLEMTTAKVIVARSGTLRPHYDLSFPPDLRFFDAFLRATHGPPARRWRAWGEWIGAALRRGKRIQATSVAPESSADTYST